MAQVRRGQPDHHLPQRPRLTGSAIPAARADRQRRLRRSSGLHQRARLQRAVRQHLRHRARRRAAGIDLLIGGREPGDGRPGSRWSMATTWSWCGSTTTRSRSRPRRFAVEHRRSGRCGAALERAAVTAEAFFREAVLSTMASPRCYGQPGSTATRPPVPRLRHRATPARCSPPSTTSTTGSIAGLGPGQALRLRGRPPTARFSSFVFYDRWFNTPDIPAHRCFLTGSDLELNPDGTYEVILGPDPGHPNWIDTAGLTEGIFAIRYLLPQQRDLPDRRGDHASDRPGTPNPSRERRQELTRLMRRIQNEGDRLFERVLTPGLLPSQEIPFLVDAAIPPRVWRSQLRIVAHDPVGIAALRTLTPIRQARTPVGVAVPLAGCRLSSSSTVCGGT